ncbi:type II toxin-antitoxin system VapC family toxin [Athalassotoga saccharophila]|uniref:type II toxin-antitoxin system VapC family toxin n=1 Tax=Athalassotoga saccharophila TaxID=1441386 RepID=UPI00137B3C32|nr:PIN domain-containing protein [Athalassotoga saccharophila]BBJ28371.1 hypothetical protein ATHSA_1284 [Athalassotoga saccharophila]
MANIEALLDTDVLLNWLCKEVTPGGEVLWKSPYKILKKAEAGKVNLYTTIVNLMEIRFVLRRRKKWNYSEIEKTLTDLQKINNFEIILPDATDMITGFNLQSKYGLDPFDAIYLGISVRLPTLLVTRDKEFTKLANKVRILLQTIPCAD